MPSIPTDLPKPPPQVFSLATPQHFLAKLYWEIANFRAQIRSSGAELFGHMHASYMAFNIAVTAWHLCDWVWHSWSEEEQRSLVAELAPGAKGGVGDFRGSMSKTCRELKICQQIANGSKHMRYENADKAVRAGMKWGLRSEHSSLRDDPKESYQWDLVIWDGGYQRYALDVFESVAEFWTRRLREWGFIEDSIILPEDDANMSFWDLARDALADARRVLDQLDDVAFQSFARAIASAKTIALHGLGREGLQMKGLAMRLFHLGLDAHVVGEMTTPPIGKDDLLICSAGPGDFATIAALMKIAQDAGAKTAVVTAQPSSSLAKSADHVLNIPAQTMADDRGANASVLPMGSLFELSQMLVFELLALRLREINGESAAAMRVRHTNLE